MKMRTRTSDNLIPKYFEGLKQLHKTLKYTNKVSVNTFCKEHKLSKNMVKVLINGKILANNGMVGRSCVWKWTGRQPDIGMATELVKRMRSININYSNEKSSVPKPIKTRFPVDGQNRQNTLFDKVSNKIIQENTSLPKPVKKNVETVDFNTEVSILWGLFSYKKKG